MFAPWILVDFVVASLSPLVCGCLNFLCRFCDSLCFRDSRRFRESLQVAKFGKHRFRNARCLALPGNLLHIIPLSLSLPHCLFSLTLFVRSTKLALPNKGLTQPWGLGDLPSRLCPHILEVFLGTMRRRFASSGPCIHWRASQRHMFHGRNQG